METLTKMNEAHVTSSEGFRVKFDRYSLTYQERQSETYQEGDRYLVVHVEHLGAPHEMVVDFSHAQGWWMQKGKPAALLSTDDAMRIRRRVEDALRFLGVNYSIED